MTLTPFVPLATTGPAVPAIADRTRYRGRGDSIDHHTTWRTTMSKTPGDIASQFKNAQRLGPDGQARSGSGIPDQQGGVPSAPGRAPTPGGPGIPGHGTGERIGVWNDRQVPASVKPGTATNPRHKP